MDSGKKKKQKNKKKVSEKRLALKNKVADLPGAMDDSF